MHRLTSLQNGLRIVTQKIEGTAAVTILIMVGAGSRFETKEINGISHFLEHMFFKGGKKYLNAQEVAEAIDAVGGDFNAFTGKEYAGYYVKVAAEKKKVAIDVLADMMVHSKFDQEEIDKERGVILEEYNMYLDTPIYQIAWDFELLMFGDQPLGWDQVGTRELIKSASRADFVKYKHDLYTPENMIIAVAGNVDHNEMVENISKSFPFEEKKKAYNFEPFKPIEISERVVIRHKKTEQAHLVLGFPAYEEQHKDHYTEKVLAVLLGGNMSSRMFLSVREKQGLSYYINSSTDDFQDIGIFSTKAGVDLKRTDLAVSSIITEYKKMVEEKVPQKELTKAKDYIKGKMILGLEDSEEYAHLIAKQALLHDKIKTPKEIMAEIDKVTVEDIARISQDIFKPEKMKLAIIGPFEDKEKFEKLLKF